MNQEQTTPMPASPMPERSDRQKINNIITIIALIVFLPVGLILMWLLASWNKKAKIIITVIAGILIITLVVILPMMVLVAMEGAREAAKDAVRRADMHMIVTVQEMYYGEHDQYHQSVNYPPSIPFYMPVMPTDPLTRESYEWIDNTGEPQRFCAYVDLKTNGFYVASHKGTGEVPIKPRTLADCEIFSPVF